MILNFGQGGVISSGTPTFSATAGGTLSLEIYLTQQGTYFIPPFTTAGDYRLSDDPAGLAGFGLGQYVFDVQSSSPAVSPGGIDTVTLGPGFFEDDALVQPGGGVLRVGGFATNDISGGVLDPVFVNEPYQATLDPNTGSLADNSILLGSITLNIDANASGDYSITAFSPYDENDLNLSLLLFGLGESLLTPTEVVFPTMASATINVTAVPEPTGFLASAAAFGIFLIRRRRVEIR